MNPAAVSAKAKPLVAYAFLLVLIPYFLAKSIFNSNYTIILIIVAGFLMFLVLKSNVFTLSLMLFLMFFGNWLEDLKFVPAQFNWLTEILVFFLFMKAISAKVLAKEKIDFKYGSSILLCLLIVVISFLFHALPLVIVALFLRLLFRYYLLFLAMANLPLEERQVKYVLNLLAFLALIQIPTAVGKFIVYGQGEFAIGTYATYGGGVSAVLPLITISFLMGYYFFYASSGFYLLAAAAFVGFGLIGGKRSILVFVPVVIIFLGYFIRTRLKNALKYALVGLLFILATGYFSLRLLPTLNPEFKERQVEGKTGLSFVKDFIIEYNMASDSGVTSGRISTSINVFNFIKEDGLVSLMFGLGPGWFIETRFGDVASSMQSGRDLSANYGVVGFSWLALQIGYLGALAYLYLFYRILKSALLFHRMETDPYWKSFGFGMLGFSFVMLLISLTYWAVFMDDLIPGVFFMLAAFFIQRDNQRNRPASPVQPLPLWRKPALVRDTA